MARSSPHKSQELARLVAETEAPMLSKASKGKNSSR